MGCEFVHLHVHSEYSLLDGAIRTKKLAEKISTWPNKSIALTDHGVLYGAVEFYENCKNAGVKPILGCETYIDYDGIDTPGRKGRNHLILLAENNTGWHNLIKLISIANTDGFYYKPRIDFELLKKYHDGLIVSSACMSGDIAKFILAGEDDKALQRAISYRDAVGENNFFLEIMPHKMQEQKLINQKLIEIHKKTGIPIIATGDAHYLNAEDYEWHKIFKKISTHSSKDDSDDFGFKDNDFYLKSPGEFWDAFGDDVPEALNNTLEIAERCNVELNLKHEKYLLPNLKLDENITPEQELNKQAHEGLILRFSGHEVPEEYLTRLEYELNVINKMGFAAYFLIVSGIIKAAKNKNIPIGPGRGSAAGSVVAWSLRITELNPLKYNLLFERFLNPERISMPDIDTDVSDKGRDELLKYISDHYGSDHVAQIITFGRMKARQSVKDVGRALKLDFEITNNLAKLVPADAKNLNEALERSTELKNYVTNDLTGKNIFEKAVNIEGLARHTSQHAAGVVITPVPITDIAPVKRLSTDKNNQSTTDQVVTQFTMEPVEKLGLVKMDFLGLITLSIIEEALNNIELNTGKRPNMEEITQDMNDPEALKILREADTIGVFQLESDGIRSMLRKLKIDRFEDLVAALAMYRPGPLDSGMVDQYIKCKNGEAKPEYPHKLLENVLKETYGVILYQEQVMQCASVLAGYSLGEADILRRAMGKKKVEVMQQQREKFLKGAEKNNIDPKTAGAIFDNIEKFAGYGFNKSHSAAYALISYETAWLKAHYRSEYMAAYLSSQMKAKKEILGNYVREVRQDGIKVLAPDINKSNENFTANNGTILFGLGAVSRIGHNAVENVIETRKAGGKFKSFWDFIKRVDLSTMNKTAIENLIKAGAFDGIEKNRAKLINRVSDYVDAFQKININKNQLGLFGIDEIQEPGMIETEDFDERTKLENEREVMGLYISGHPYDKYSEKINIYANCNISEIPSWKDRDIKFKFGGLISSITNKTTKKGDPMLNILVEDAENNIQCTIFNNVLEKMERSLILGSACLFEGKYNDKGLFNITKIYMYDELDNLNKKFVRVKLKKVIDPKKFYAILKNCRGKSQVLLEYEDSGIFNRVLLGENVDPDKFRDGLLKILNDGEFKITAG